MGEMLWFFSSASSLLCVIFCVSMMNDVMVEVWNALSRKSMHHIMKRLRQA